MKRKNKEVKEKVEKVKKEEIEETEEIEEKESSKVIKIIKELIPYIVILIVVVVIRTFFYTPIMVSGPSMNPTLEDGDIMILNKRGKIERFDIVVVDTGTEPIIKRVIALPGETIQCENDKVYVNHRLQEENMSKGNTCAIESMEFKYELGEDEYFVMGDNRSNSTDSRIIGPVKKEQIKGKTHLILYPFKRFGNVK